MEQIRLARINAAFFGADPTVVQVVPSIAETEALFIVQKSAEFTNGHTA